MGVIFLQVIFEPVTLDEFVERKYGERKAGHRGEEWGKETKKNSEIENRVSRKNCSSGSNATKRRYGGYL